MDRSSILKIISSIEAGASVFTVNARLARHIRSQFDREMSGRGLLAWQTPEVLPFYSWTGRVWEENSIVPVLAGVRSKALWEGIVSQDKTIAEEALLANGAARASFEAYSILKGFGLKLPKDEIYLTEEAKALKRWSEEFESRVRALGYIDENSVPEGVATLIKAGVAVPGSVVLAGFDELTPAVLSVVAALRGRGAKVSLWPDYEGLKEGAISVRPYADETEEVVQAARWARKTLKPGMRIGFIVPELERYRSVIMREFASELNPASVLLDGERREVFNISLGLSLIEEPLVSSAIDMLSAGEGKEDLALISRILLSPFFNGGDLIDYARADLALKEDNTLSLSLYDLRARLRRMNGFGLGQRLDEWIGWLKASRKKREPSHWAEAFSTLLKKVRWLQGIKLTGREYQALKAWNSALERFASLDDMTGPVGRAEAVARLTAIVRESMHQPETPECNIEVLGLLEATGLSFDHVWLMGCHEFAVPAEPSPNPFIPVWLQKSHNIPHSSSERELVFAKEVIGRVLRSAPEITVSYPMRSEDRDLCVSPLFRDRGLSEEALIDESGALMDAARAVGGLEELPEEKDLPVSPEELAFISGGTSIIKNQSLCPFKAFAAHRLYAKEMPSPELGLKPEARGSILHTALKLFWEKVEGSEELGRMKEANELEAYIKDLTEAVMKEADVPPPLSSRFVEIERERLKSLLTDWAEVELRRGSFKVKKVELEREIEIGGLKIKGRVDRVDDLGEGKEGVIDYKSGRTDRNDWTTGRPRDPQLLIYSVTGKFNAVSFARLAPGECKFVGISKDEGVLPGIKPFESDKFRDNFEGRDWEGLMEFWRTAIEGLAKEFLAGVASVDPNGGSEGEKSACKYCDFTVLCRVGEAGVDADEDNE